MRRIRKPLTAALLTFAFLTGSSPAGAWNEFQISLASGCKGWAESWAIAGGGHAATIRVATGGCGNMHARVRSLFGGSPWVANATNASVNLVDPTSTGGAHKLCTACAVSNT